ncbi:hypothetical protein AAEO56_12900 [Flavobacterium sp. DGU11]|uniref:Uncharacterized protein n=1 Tax=Flavobacterium arundinis TaxID=3139143 RepID=A0ABU9I035_9FLAO
MKKIYLSALILITAIIANAQERVSPTIPVINPVAKGKLTEATGWLQNDSGVWISKKNKVPANLKSDSSLFDYEKYGLGENEENFIYFELREITIDGKSLTILIKKYNDGDYRYKEIKKDWMPSTTIVYFVFETAELEKLKNLEPDKTHNIIIPTLYFSHLYNLDAKSSLKTIAKNVIEDGIFNKGSDKLAISVKFFKDKTRFLIETESRYPDRLDFEKSYYETPTVNFEKLFTLK